MMLQKENLLVQITVGDLQQLIKEAVKEEISEITKTIQLTSEGSLSNDDLLTKKATAKFLNVSETTLYLWNRDKILIHKKINNRVYYLKSDLLNKIKTAA